MAHRNLISAGILAAVALAPVPAAAAPVQALTDADGRALVLIPLTLTKIEDLDFGGVIPSASAGTVTVNAATGARTFSGGATGVPGDAGNRAYFGGAGSPNQQVLVSLSPPTELTSAAGDTITVLGLTLDGPPMRSIDPVARTFFVGVGGTLQIAADQPAGDYSADFWVTAIYQ
ncbi:MAG: DUF4402 domain-containing protein [Alphaproteobacteria bacterium]